MGILESCAVLNLYMATPRTQTIWVSGTLRKLEKRLAPGEEPRTRLMGPEDIHFLSPQSFPICLKTEKIISSSNGATDLVFHFLDKQTNKQKLLLHL